MAEKSATMIELAIVLGLLALVLGGIAFGFGLCFLMFMVTFHPTEKRESVRRCAHEYDYARGSPGVEPDCDRPALHSGMSGD